MAPRDIFLHLKYIDIFPPRELEQDAEEDLVNFFPEDQEEEGGMEEQGGGMEEQGEEEHGGGMEEIELLSDDSSDDSSDIPLEELRALLQEFRLEFEEYEFTPMTSSGTVFSGMFSIPPSLLPHSEDDSEDELV